MIWKLLTCETCPPDHGSVSTGRGPGVVTDLLGAPFKDHILLALVQPSLSHGPVMQHPVLPLEELIQDVWENRERHMLVLAISGNTCTIPFVSMWRLFKPSQERIVNEEPHSLLAQRSQRTCQPDLSCSLTQFVLWWQRSLETYGWSLIPGRAGSGGYATAAPAGQIWQWLEKHPHWISCSRAFTPSCRRNLVYIKGWMLKQWSTRRKQRFFCFLLKIKT